MVRVRSGQRLVSPEAMLTTITPLTPRIVLLDLDRVGWCAPSPDPTARGARPAQELNVCWVFSKPSWISDSTASAARSTWKASSLRSVLE